MPLICATGSTRGSWEAGSHSSATAVKARRGLSEEPDDARRGGTRGAASRFAWSFAVGSHWDSSKSAPPAAAPGAITRAAAFCASR